MKENFVRFSYDLIFVFIAVSAFLLPLAFLPTTTEFFDFNKFTIIFTLTLAGLLIWALRMVVERKASFTRTPLDIPLLVFLAIIFIASYASIDQFSSLFGSPQKIWPSFFPIATLVAFYFLASSNIKKKKQVNLILWVLSTSTAAASVIAVLSYFGIFLPFDFAQIRSFNTVGVITRLALLQSFVIPITLFYAVFDKNGTIRIISTIFALTALASLVLINHFPAYLSLAVALLFMGTASLKTKLDKRSQGSIALISIFAILFLVIRFVPQVANGTIYQWIQQKDPNSSVRETIRTPQEKTLPQRVSWDIAAQAIGKRPLFGTGPGTFQFVYTQLKPLYVNGTTDWALRFNKSSSDFMEYVATIGIFGILAYLLVMVAALRFIWALVFKSQHSLLYIGISSALIGYLASAFFSLSSFATAGAFFLVLALLSALAKAMDESDVFDVTIELAALKNRLSWLPVGPSADVSKSTHEGRVRSQALPILFLATVALVGGLSAKSQIQTYIGEYHFRQSLLASRSNDGNRTIQFVQQALRANPKIDAYHRSLAQFSLNAAINLTQKGNLTDQEKQLLSQLAQVSIDQAKVASGYQILPLKLPGISAANVENWEILSSVYQALIGSVQGADVHATNTLAQAVALDPQNPILHDRLGQLYQKLGNKDLAQRKFEDSIYVKRDYGPGYYRLAKLLIENKGENAKIVEALTQAKRFLDAKDPAIAQIDKDIADYTAKLAEDQKSKVAGEKTENKDTSPSPSPSASPQVEESPVPSATPLESPSF